MIEPKRGEPEWHCTPTSHAHITTRTSTLNTALMATRHTRSRVCSAHQLSIPLPESPHHPAFSRLCWGFQPTPSAAFSSESSSVQTALKSSPALPPSPPCPLDPQLGTPEGQGSAVRNQHSSRFRTAEHRVPSRKVGHPYANICVSGRPCYQHDPLYAQDS